ncbi:MAG: cytoplasmic protein [Desulfobacteraceae bacterium]|nr:cytoplasmic protein [Desulfobacteraceae bacterium]
MKKFALFVFNGDPMCFIHVLLNALDMNEKGHQVKIILEGASVKLIPELTKTENPLNKLWEKVLGYNLLEGACKACSNKLGTLDNAKKQGIVLLSDMSGHPAMSDYRENDFEIITF